MVMISLGRREARDAETNRRIEEKEVASEREKSIGMKKDLDPSFRCKLYK